MPTQIVSINTSHYMGGNTYSFKFPQNVKMDNCTLSVYSASMYNSTYNISSSLGNNTFSIVWLSNTFNIAIPDGYYSFDDINSFIEQQCIINKLYCTTSTGDYVYFINVSANAVRYRSQIDVYPIPTSATATSNGWSLPSGASWSFPVTAATPQLIISSGLKSLFGFSLQTSFPVTVGSTSSSTLGDIYPTISPIFSYVFTCNLVNSAISIPSGVFFQLPVTASYGGLIEANVSQNSSVTIQDGSYNDVTIQLWDQDFNPLSFQDPALSMSLLISIPE